MFFNIKYWWYGYLCHIGTQLSMLGWHKQKDLLEIKRRKEWLKRIKKS